MLVLGLLAGCTVGAISQLDAPTTFGPIALVVTVAFMVPVSLAVALLCFAGYVLGRRLVSRAGGGESSAVIAGFATAVVAGTIAVGTAGLTLEWFSPENCLWPTVSALGGTLCGAALALLLRNEPRAITLPLD